MKKSYAGFMVWLVLYVGAMLGIVLLPAEDINLQLRLLMLLTAWWMAGLAFHVWRTEQIYWYNGTEYDAAVAAGSQRRKTFAWRYLRIFGILALVVTAVAAVTGLLGWSAWIDLTVCTVGLIAAAICTTKIRL